ncbi:MAG TPA: hypothetical protein VGG20_10705 [Thermoanaerobaculia bacterium]|jgi:hypothetical protein
MHWLEVNSGAVAALSSVLLTVITIVYVYLTGRLVKESQEMRAAILQPELAIYLHPLEGSPNFIILRIENVGAGPARKIQLKTDRPFETAHTKDLREVGIFRKGISYLAPRQRIDHFLVSVIGKLEELVKRPLLISASYNDAAGKAHTQEFVLDFGEMENLAWIGKPPLQEIAGSIKQIQGDFGRVATGFNKLHVLTQPLANYNRSIEAQTLAWRLESLSQEQITEIEALVAKKEQERESIPPSDAVGGEGNA